MKAYAHPTNGTHAFAASIGLLVLSIALRPAIVSIGPILLLIQRHFALSYTQAALLTSIPDLCMSIFALLAPKLTQRFGTDRCVVAALTLLGTATVLRALSPSPLLLLGSTFLISVGIAVAGALIGGWIKSHFPQRAAVFMGIYAAGLSLGATIGAVFAAPIAELTESWRISAGVWSILCVTAVISWAWMSKRFESKGPARQDFSKAHVRLPWTRPQAWLVALNFGAGQFVVYALFAWLAPASTETAVTHLPSGVLLGLFTAVFAVASVGAGMLPGKAHDRRPLLGTSSLLAVFALSGMWLAPTLAPTVYVVLAAVGLGMGFTIAMTLPLDNVDTPEQASAWTVFMLFIGYLIAALGPLCFGALRDHSGSYTLSYETLFGVTVLMFCLTPILKPAPKENLHTAPA